jgi:lysozyme
MNRERLLEQLRLDEGVVNEIYLDSVGKATFGVGHLVVKSDPEYGKPVGTEVTEARVESCFEEDVNTAIADCVALFENWESFPGEVQEILVNMAFNLGQTKLRKFVKFKKQLEHGRWQAAAKEGRDSLWYRQVKNRAERLMSRLEEIPK